MKNFSFLSSTSLWTILSPLNLSRIFIAFRELCYGSSLMVLARFGFFGTSTILHTFRFLVTHRWPVLVPACFNEMRIIKKGPRNSCIIGFNQSNHILSSICINCSDEDLLPTVSRYKYSTESLDLVELEKDVISMILTTHLPCTMLQYREYHVCTSP